jgi:hypothetical protein
MKNLIDKFPSPAMAKEAIIENIQTQAYIQGLNDALVAFGYITAFISVILFALIFYEGRKADAGRTDS